MVDISAIKSSDKGGKKAGPKIVKFKLTKEQQAFVDGMVKLDNRIAVCQEYIAMWTNYFRLFADLNEKTEITPEAEKAFFQLSTQIARKHFHFVELMGDCFDKGGDIMNLLATGASLTVLQGMQEQTRGKFDLDWHTLFLEMNKALGRLLRMLPGNMTLNEAIASLGRPAATPGGKPAAAKK